MAKKLAPSQNRNVRLCFYPMLAVTFTLVGCMLSPGIMPNLEPKLTDLATAGSALLPSNSQPDSQEVGLEPASDEATPLAVRTTATTGIALYVSTTGNDSNSGSSSSSPLRNINTAAKRAKPNTTIYIKGGTYYEQLVTKVGGLAGQEIIFTSYEGTAVIDGSKLNWSIGLAPNYGLVELRHPYVRLTGLKIANSKNSGIILVSDHLTIKNCEIAGTQTHGISNHLSRHPAAGYPLIRDITVSNNLVHDTCLYTGSQAISMAADGFLVSGNKVYNNKNIGIDVWMEAKHGEVVDNIVYSHRSIGIYVDGATYVRIHRNRAYANSTGITVSSETGYNKYGTHHIWVYNNLSYDNTNGAGISIWDIDTGATDVLITNNTLINNKFSIYLGASGNSAEIMNNLGYATGSSVYNISKNSTYKIHDNIWMSGPTGFVSAANKDFRLVSSSPAINKGRAIPSFSDDLGNVFKILTDFAKLGRVVNGYPDAGAYEYQ
ncbi:MAG: right-handed parallel beta-helix repeat-containing protein [Cyanobacteria bacterium NC_groundwater_1444_Ag_S-0.65um_54_12]|nr:right-handed parallel beta-helix repeat-containing protein [Cyanobacteria bacterium NC_groundwater_1444_Ag_S-0.65um_54_12]